MEYYDYENELYHHGIKGMRWGIRRFQNADGSLKPEGEKRYGSGRSLGQTIKAYKTKKQRQKNLAKAREAKIEKQKTAEERAKLIAKGKIRPKDMTQEELNDRITRLESERRVKQLEREAFEASKGKKFVDGLMNKVVTPAATAAGEQFLRKYLNDVGDDVLSSIKDAKAKQDPNKRMLAEIDKLKNEHTKLDYQKKINDLKNPKESIDDKLNEAKKRLEYSRITDEELQQTTRDAKVAENRKKISDPNYDWRSSDSDRDKNINGIDDDEEEKDK